MGEAKRKKLSRDARLEEILPGRHGPVQDPLVAFMTTILDVCREQLPGYDFTFFVSERDATAGPDRLPRFNYMSTCEREDMVNVLKAFVQKNAEMLHVDAAMARKPEGSA